MKCSIANLFLFGLALVAFGMIASLMGQQPSSLNHVPLAERLKTYSDQETLDIVRAAFKQKDVKMLLACLQYQKSSGYLLNEYEASQDQDWKARVAVAMLREPALWNPPADDFSRGGIAMLSVVEMIAPVISAKLQNAGSLENLAVDTQLRQRIADQLEASITSSPKINPPLNPLVDPVQPQSSHAKSTSLPAPIVQASSPPKVKASKAKPSPTSPSEEPTSSTPWRIIVVLIVAACGLLWLLWLLLKRRS
jgi:hypothetical protein